MTDISQLKKINADLYNECACAEDNCHDVDQFYDFYGFCEDIIHMKNISDKLSDEEIVEMLDFHDCIRSALQRVELRQNPRADLVLKLVLEEA